MTVEKILTQYGQLLSSVDQWFNRCLSITPPVIHCGKGCSSCCRGLFDITLLDAFYLKQGFDALETELKQRVIERAEGRLAAVKVIWPEFVLPYTLNHRPDEEWQEIMPEDDESPCVLLDDHGQCLLYHYRPMTCRLHGIPLIDIDGEVMDADGCSFNPALQDIVSRPEMHFKFIRLFKKELSLFREFTWQLLKVRLSELDTLIPAAVLLHLDGDYWLKWSESLKSKD